MVKCVENANFVSRLYYLVAQMYEGCYTIQYLFAQSSARMLVQRWLRTKVRL